MSESSSSADTLNAGNAQDISGGQSFADPSFPDLDGHMLLIYCSEETEPPYGAIWQIACAFERDTGCNVHVSYENAEYIQSRIRRSEEGDMMITGYGDELKPVVSYVESKKELAKYIPVLVVQSGNPKNIFGLENLTGKNVKLMMGENLSFSPIGKIAKKALTDAGIFDKVHIKQTAVPASQMPAAIAAGEADAAIVWKGNCDIEGVEIVDTRDLEPYIKIISAASLNCSEDRDALDGFNRYLDTDSVRTIWMRYGYEIVE